MQVVLIAGRVPALIRGSRKVVIGIIGKQGVVAKRVLQAGKTIAAIESINSGVFTGSVTVVWPASTLYEKVVTKFSASMDCITWP